MAEGRLVDAVADGTVLSGTAEALAERLGVNTADLRAAVGGLAEAGWIAVESDPNGRLSVRWERRSGRGPAPVERRRPRPDRWDPAG